MRVDEKEDWLSELCDRYGLWFDYGWGYYYVCVVGIPVKSQLLISRYTLSSSTLEQIEQTVLEYVLLNGW